jgi:Immunoglobulin-like domain of bacterial spore germination.
MNMKNPMKFAISWLFVCLVGILLFIAVVLLMVIHNLYSTPIVIPAFAPPSVNAPVGKAPAVTITSPRLNDLLTSPLTATGEARGWYFEGSFPVELKDENGAILAMGQATAQGDWMSSDFVAFKATLTFAKPTSASGTLILKKDNPSGLPANDDQVSVPVQFDLNAPSWSASAPVAACRVSGCSSQICSDTNEITDCMYLPG